ncbi:N-acetylglucosamine kinase [Clostridium lundense]|uniref:N-acetylglucosamine kinase n=1 Tax=Clostridium lundense TaxID=319475 RepID=UPI0004843006|nr:BadF/BadG/BcrA/BcrD ATPase family protein [Clostridium lundense]
MEYVIGIDGGGTKTEAIAYDFQGNELFRNYSEFGNLAVDKEKALFNIESTVDKSIKVLGSDCRYIYLGLAGVESGNNKEFIETSLKNRFNTKVKAVNDADIALSAVLEGKDGILTIAGTGSISYGVYKGITARAGGWGHLLGDEGSGYYIAIEAFKKVIEERDLGIKESLLSRQLLKGINIWSDEDIKDFIYSNTKGKVAGVAPIVIEAANNGEENAINIVKKSTNALGDITFKVYKRLGIEEDVNIGIKGSILTKSKLVKGLFEDYIKENIKGFRLVDNEISPTKGAYYLAMKELNSK